MPAQKICPPGKAVKEGPRGGTYVLGPKRRKIYCRRSSETDEQQQPQPKGSIPSAKPKIAKKKRTSSKSKKPAAKAKRRSSSKKTKAKHASAPPSAGGHKECWHFEVDNEKRSFCFAYATCRDLDKWALFKKKISCGLYGCVFAPEDSMLPEVQRVFKTKDVVIKITRDYVEEALNQSDFGKEMEIAALMGDIGVGPKVYSAMHIECPDDQGNTYNGIVMQRLHSNIPNWFRAMKTEKDLHAAMIDFQKQMEQLLTKMHNEGYVHGDLHLGNVMIGLDAKQQKPRLYLVDFGLAQKITAKNKNLVYKDNTMGRSLIVNQYRIESKTQK